MKIRALRTLRGDAGNIRRGAVAEVSDSAARSLIQRGLAAEVEEEGGQARKRPKPRAKAANAPKAKTTKGAAAPKKGD